MKNASFILVLIFLQMITACKQKIDEIDKSSVYESNLTEEKINPIFENLFLEFNSNLIYEAMLCIGKEEGLEMSEDVDWNELYFGLNDSLNKTVLLNQITKLSDRNSGVLYRIENYCHLATALKTPFIYDIEEPFYFGELLYELELTKGLVENFFNHPDQSWESLSTSQSIELYHKTLLYLSSLKPGEQLSYVIDYYSLCQQKIRNNNLNRE